ncbi:MAG: sigma-70 family RNA polymerase sigma factor [Planctomycetes bacterium]|nr:sigma-70 family RNA polymerase sigma factor [Planctomycetota bacterium]
MEQPVDARLIGDLLDSHGAALELYASGWTNSPEDCVQESLVELARRLQPPEHTVAWLYHVVRNRAKNAGRADRRRVRHEQIAAQLAGERNQQTISDIERLALPEALEAMSAEDRELVVLRIWSGLTWQEIAEVSQTSSSGAQRRYAAALKQLRHFLEPSCLPKIVCRRS